MKTKLWSFLLLFFILSLTLLPHSAAEINVSTKLRIAWEGNKFDPKTGITSYTLSLKNYSLETLSGPFKVIIEKVDNRYVSIKPSDGYTSEGKPYFIYEKDKLAPGEKTAPRVWKFEHQCKNISIVFFRELRLFKFLTQLKCSPTAICYNSIFGEVATNHPPIAEAGSDLDVTVGDLVPLDGRTSHDPDGDLITYNWSITTAPSGSTAALDIPTSVVPTFTPDRPGTYTVSLVVSDGKAFSVPDLVEITAAMPNVAPTANAGPDQSVITGSIVSLDGSPSFDPDGDALTYEWQILSRPEGSTAYLFSDPSPDFPKFLADREGNYLIQLRVSDGSLYSLPDDVIVVSATPNAPPLAFAGEDQPVEKNTTIQLNGLGSFDPNNDSLTYAWMIVSMPAGSISSLDDPASPTPRIIADKAGDYVFRLVVYDGELYSNEDTVVVIVTNDPPVANAGPDRDGAIDVSINLDGRGSSDSNGDVLTYLWSIVSAPSGSTTPILNPTSTTPAFTPDHPGTYVVQLVVNDGTENSTPDTAALIVSTPVPPLVGLTEAAAFSNIGAARLAVGTVTYLNNPTVPASYVVSQTPLPGTLALAGAAISFVVSLGPANVNVPNVVEIAHSTAESTIRAANLNVGNVTTANSLIVPAGSVISQDPIAGISVPEGSSVNLLISLGPLMATVPNVVAISQAAAEAAIVSAGLSVGLITTANSNTVPVGSVISQNPAAGVSLAQGSAVDLVVSLGPSGEPPVNGVLLEGPPEAFAETALRNIEQINGTEESEIGLDERGDRISRIQLLIHFEPNATVGEINGLLQTIGARIVWMMPDVPQLLIQFPDPGSLQALNDLVTQLQASPVIGEVLRGYFPGTSALPQPYDPLSLDSDSSTPDDFKVIDHLISVGAPAAWNARSGVSITNPPVVMVVDYFGAGPVSSPPFGVRVTEPRLFSRTTYDIRRFADGSPIGQHGYHVMGIIGSDFGGELPTGMFPGTAINQLEVEPLDIGLDPNPTHPRRRLMSWLDIKATILSRLRLHLSNRNVVVNTSIGFACADHRTNPPTPIICGNSLAEKQGLSWTKAVRAAGLEDKFVHVTAAGNEIPPGDIDAAYTSPFAAAALLPLVDRSGNAVPNLNNTLVVENVVNVTTGPPYRPECLWGGLPDPASGLPYGGSKVGGNIAAIGTNVRSYIRPSQVNDNFEDVTKNMTGTSMATPLVAGVASYMWAFNPALAPERIVRAIISLAHPLNIPEPEQLPSYCRSIAEQGAPVINAYGSVLWVDEPVALSAAGTPADAPVRSAILDVADSAGVEGSDGVFDQGDLKVLVDKISQGVLPMQSQCMGYDWSRYDLSGDGHTGADRGNRFNLNINKPAALTYVTAPEDPNMTFNESCVTDLQIICYYAYSSLYTGSTIERDNLLHGFCDHGQKTWRKWEGPFVSTSNQFFSKKLAADGRGNVFAAYNEVSLVIGRVGSGEITDKTGFPMESLVDFVVDNSGNMIVVSWDYRAVPDYRLIARRYNVEGGWDETPTVLSTGAPNLIFNTSIAADGCGNAIIAWSSMAAETPFAVGAVRYDALRGWESPILFPFETALTNLNTVKIAMNTSGNAILIWTGYTNGDHAIWARKYNPYSGWEIDSTLIASPHLLYDYNIVMNSQGNAIVTSFSPNGTRATHYNINTGWQRSILIADNGGVPRDGYRNAAYSHMISMDECGNAMLVYQQLLSGYPGPSALMSKSYRIDEGWDDTGTIVEAVFTSDIGNEGEEANGQGLLAFTMLGGGNATLVTGEWSTETSAICWNPNTPGYHLTTCESCVYPSSLISGAYPRPMYLHARKYQVGKGWADTKSTIAFGKPRWGGPPSDSYGYYDDFPLRIIDRYGNATFLGSFLGETAECYSNNTNTYVSTYMLRLE